MLRVPNVFDSLPFILVLKVADPPRMGERPLLRLLRSCCLCRLASDAAGTFQVIFLGSGDGILAGLAKSSDHPRRDETDLQERILAS